MIRFLGRCDHYLGLVLRWFSAICLALLALVLSAVVFVRFVPIARLSWSDEVVEWTFAWMVFMGAAALWRGREHFCVDAVACKLEEGRYGVYLRGLIEVLSTLFFVLFTYYGFKLAWQASDRSPILEWPRPLWYSCLPFSGAIMLIYSLRNLVQVLGRIISPGPSNRSVRPGSGISDDMER